MLKWFIKKIVIIFAPSTVSFAKEKPESEGKK